MSSNVLNDYPDLVHLEPVSTEQLRSENVNTLNVGGEESNSASVQPLTAYDLLLPLTTGDMLQNAVASIFAQEDQTVDVGSEDNGGIDSSAQSANGRVEEIMKVPSPRSSQYCVQYEVLQPAVVEPTVSNQEPSGQNFVSNIPVQIHIQDSVQVVQLVTLPALTIPAPSTVSTAVHIIDKSLPQLKQFKSLKPKPAELIVPLPPQAKPNDRFYCPHPNCPNTYSRRGSLSDHISAKHEITKRYRCTWGTCTRMFSRSQHTKEHIRVAHLNISKNLAKQKRKGLKVDNGLDLNNYFVIDHQL